MFRTKVVKKMETRNLYATTFFENRAVYIDMIYDMISYMI